MDVSLVDAFHACVERCSRSGHEPDFWETIDGDRRRLQEIGTRLAAAAEAKGIDSTPILETVQSLVDDWPYAEFQARYRQASVLLNRLALLIAAQPPATTKATAKRQSKTQQTIERVTELRAEGKTDQQILGIMAREGDKRPNYQAWKQFRYRHGIR